MLKDTTPRHIQTDMGKEFYNKLLRELFQRKKVKHNSVYSQFKASLVERFNRTLREKFNKYFTHTGKKVWYNVLSDIINTYNNTKHRGIFSMKPAEVTRVNEMELWDKQQEVKGLLIKPTYKLLDYVRISRLKGLFLKNFDQNWSGEVFRIFGIDQHLYPGTCIIEH